MAKNEDPIFVRDPVIGTATISTANTDLDGTGAISSVVNGDTDGVEIKQIEVKATGTTTAGMVRLFLSFDGGTTWELWREIDISAITPDGTTQAFYGVIDLTAAGEIPLRLADSNMALGASTHEAEEFNVFARGGSLAA